jgi:hypothetical protein
MQWDTITDQWPWFAAAGLPVVLIAALAMPYFYKSKSKPDDPIQDQQDGWTPTGRIDFTNSAGNFILQAEETRSNESLGGVEHRTIRWRRGTLDEAKRVVLEYHAHRNLSMRPILVVTSSRSMVQGQLDQKNEHQQDKLKEGSLP